MTTGIEIGLLVLAVLVLAAVYITLKVIKPLVYNAIIGLVLLFIINLTGVVEVDITLFAVAIIAVAGVPGVVLVALLAFLGVAFAPGAVAPLVF